MEGPRDFDRRLDDSGRAGVSRIARVLRENGHKPDLLLASASARTAETARIVAEELEIADRRSLDTLYLAGSKRLIEVLESEARQGEDDARSVIMIAHNPGLSDFGTDLDPNRGVALSPGDAAVFGLDTNDWRLVSAGVVATRALYRARTASPPG